MSSDYYQLNEVEVVYRPIQDFEERPIIRSSRDAHELFRSNWDDMRIGYREEAKMLLLNRNNRVLGIANLSSGGIAGTVVDPKVIFTTALKCAATSIILAHNHPSGQMQPSLDDLKIQRKVIEGGKVLDISVLDHIILSGTDSNYHSMADSLDLK